MSDSKKYPIKSERLWALYARLEDAEQAVLENRGDLFEYSYNYALIEEIFVIDPDDKPSKEESYFPPKEWWYEAKYNRDPTQDADPDPIISKVEKPSCLEKTVYFWAG
jgi:hypothetical protein